MRIALLVPVAAAIAIAAGGSALASADRTAAGLPCANKVSKVQGKTAIGYCGPATATVTVGGKTYHYAHGLCIKTEAFTVQLGTFVEGSATNGGLPELDFSATGTNGSLGGFSGGKKVIPDLDYLITVKGAGKGTGTFTNGPNGPKLSGSWNCHGEIYKGSGA